MKTKHVLSALSLSLLLSCENSDDSLKQTVDKKGSVEMNIEVQHATGMDVIKTTKNVWVKNSLMKTFVSFDTLPALGDTVRTMQDSLGNDKTVRMPIDYELYITVK
jgi:hypothetical protein